MHFALQGDKLLALKEASVMLIELPALYCMSVHFQGAVQVYGSHAELAERNIDAVQLLGLIQLKKSERDEFVIDEDFNDEGAIATSSQCACNATFAVHRFCVRA